MRAPEQVLQTFVDAYDRHDVGSVIRLLEFKQDSRYVRLHMYGDCDYARRKQGTLFDLSGADRLALRRWLRERFAEGDQFQVTSWQWIPEQPQAVGFLGYRSNDVLKSMGIDRAAIVPKFIVNDKGDKIARSALGGPCSPVWLTSVQRATIPRSGWAKASAMAFVDGYNDHNLFRMGELLANGATARRYHTPSQRTGTIRGAAKITRWLGTRFRHGDRLTTVRLSVPDQLHPQRVRVDAVLTAGHAPGRSVDIDVSVATLPDQTLRITALDFRYTG